MAVHLDTHQLVKELITAGFTEVQAEAVMRAVAVARDLDLSHLATEAGVEQQFLLQQKDFQARFDALRKDFDALRKDVDTKNETLRKDVDTRIEGLGDRIEAVRSELKGDIEAVRSELKGDIEGVRTEFRTEMALLRRDMTIRLGAMIAVAVVVVTALDKLL